MRPRQASFWHYCTARPGRACYDIILAVEKVIWAYFSLSLSSHLSVLGDVIITMYVAAHQVALGHGLELFLPAFSSVILLYCHFHLSLFRLIPILPRYHLALSSVVSFQKKTTVPKKIWIWKLLERVGEMLAVASRQLTRIHSSQLSKTICACATYVL